MRVHTLVALVAVAGCNDPAPPVVPPPVEDEAPKTVVADVQGEVTKSSKGGEWKPVKAGETVAIDESLRTAPGARASLQVGDDSTISLTSDTEVTVAEVTKAVEVLELRRGRLSVDHKSDGGRLLRVQSSEGEAVIETRGAKFNVADTGTSFAVATDTGEVDLTAADETVKVAAGEQSLVRRGLAPTAAAPVPTELLLKVARSGKKQGTDRVCTVVRGEATPGAEVTVAGEVVDVNPAGRFEVEVPRTTGMRSARVLIRDAAGRDREESVKCDPIPRPPDEIENLHIDWGEP